MRDPFKRVRARAVKQLSRKTIAAATDAWGAMLGIGKPVKRKAKVAAKSGRAAKAPATGRKAKGAAKPQTLVPAHTNTATPRGAAFDAGTHTTGFGTRAYKIYVPAVAKAAPDPLPLIVMLHGCGQTAQDFANGTGMNTLAEVAGFVVLYPEQSRKAQPNRCWGWFRRSDQVRGAGEPALIADLTRHIIADHRIDPARVYVAGLSAGASAALILATAYPDIFAAVGVHSGLSVGAAHDTVSAAKAMQIGDPGQRHAAPMPTITFHGDADKIVNPRNGRYVAMRALEPYGPLDRTAKTGTVPGGHGYTRVTHRIGKGRPYTEHWVVHGAGHAWSGGNAASRHTDPAGPDASREMVRFFLRHRTTQKRRSRAAV